jgi:hypothetical protein
MSDSILAAPAEYRAKNETYRGSLARHVRPIVAAPATAQQGGGV